MAEYERDSQRTKVYNSINAASKAVGKPLGDMNEIHALVAKIQSRATLQRRYGKTLKDIIIADGRHNRWSHGDRKGICTPRAERTTIYIARALAYTISARHRSSRYKLGAGSRHDELYNPKQAWTGWEYCAILMDIVRYGLGEKEADALLAEFDKRNVKWKKPRERVMTPEQKAKAQIRGRELAAQNRDRKRRLEYVAQNPDAKLLDADTFADEYWETLYRVWR